MKKWLETDNFEEAFDKFNDNADEIEQGFDNRYTKQEVDDELNTKADKLDTYTKTEVDASLGLKANKQQEAWITPTLLNGWVNAKVAYEPLSYVKDSLGWVWIRGTISGGTAGTVFNLPVGYRANKIHMFAVNHIERPSSYGYVNSNGNVEVNNLNGRLIINVSFYAGF